MALENKAGGGNVAFLSVIEGEIRQKVADGTPGAVVRKNKLGNDISELKFNSLSGTLERVSIKKSEDYGNQYEVLISDADAKYVLQLPQSGRMGSSLVSRLPNIDPNYPIEINTWMVSENGKNKSLLSVKQKGQTVKSAFTKENPNGLPPLEQVTFKGQLAWDDSKQLAFYEKLIDKYFPAGASAEAKPAEPAPATNHAKKATPAAKQEVPVVQPEESDDLPF